jgi:hypothetical protein
MSDPQPDADRTPSDHSASPASDQASKGQRSGLVQGGLGGDEDELLEVGQEEVFSRTEVETGRIEHHAETDRSPSPDEASGKAS